MENETSTIEKAGNGIKPIVKRSFCFIGRIKKKKQVNGKKIILECMGNESSGSGYQFGLAKAKYKITVERIWK